MCTINVQFENVIKIRCTVKNLTEETGETKKSIRSVLEHTGIDGNTTKWLVQVFPKGDQPCHKNFLGVFLGLMRSDLGAMCCSIRLSVFEGQSEKNIIEQNALIEINSHWSNSEYLNRRNLFAAKKSVELTFMFTVTVYNTERKGVVFDAEYSNAMECFYKDKNFADFELIVQGKVLKAHKAILVARSELFSKFIVNQTQQNLSGVGFSKMFIKNYEVEVIEEILRFLYLNKVERLDKLASNLLLAANAYQIRDLKDHVELFLKLKTDNGNVLEHLKLATSANCEKLKLHAIKHIKNNSKATLRSLAWKEFIKTHQKLRNDVVSALLFDCDSDTEILESLAMEVDEDEDKTKFMNIIDDLNY